MASPLKSDPCVQKYVRLQGGGRCRLAALWTLASDVVQGTTCAALHDILGGQNPNRVFKDCIAFDHRTWRGGLPGG